MNSEPPISLTVSSIFFVGRLHNIGANAWNSWTALSFDANQLVSLQARRWILPQHSGGMRDPKAPKLLSWGLNTCWRGPGRPDGRLRRQLFPWLRWPYLKIRIRTRLKTTHSGYSLPLRIIRTIHRCSSAVDRLYMRCRIFDWMSLNICAMWLHLMVVNRNYSLFTHVLRKFIENLIDLINCQRPFDDRGPFANNLE